MNIETMLSAYITCALWSSTDMSDKPLDENYGREDISEETLSSMRADVESFAAANAGDIESRGYDKAGHDFWLTRNGHGVGFWDGDWPSEVGERLTKASEAFGSVDLYVGDDGKIYSSR